MKLSTKLPLLTVPLIVVPLLLVGILGGLGLNRSAETQSRIQMSASLAQVADKLVTVIHSARADLNMLAQDELLKSYLLTDSTQERYLLMQQPLLYRLRNFQRLIPTYYEMRLLLPDGFEEVRLTNRPLPNHTEFESTSPFFIHSAQEPGDLSVLLNENPDNHQIALFITRRLTFINEATETFNAMPRLRGYLSLTLDPAEVVGLEQVLPWRGAGLAITDGDGRVVLASRSLELLSGGNLPMAHDTPGEIGTLLLDNQRFRYQSRRVGAGLWAHILVPEANLFGSSRQVSYLALLVTLVAVAIAVPLLLYHLRRQVLNPLRTLNRAIMTFGSQPQPVRIPVCGTDEISQLTEAFNLMSNKLFESRQQIDKLAFLDPLTGLPNRLMFTRMLERDLRLAAFRHGRLAVLFIDLDNFKGVNDTLGHPAGDRLLKEIALRLQGCLRRGDRLGCEISGRESAIARLGGDEFIVLLPDLTSREDAARVAARIIEVTTEAVLLDNHPSYVGASIGIALFPEDGESVSELLKHADLAMYQAKKQGKGNFQYFSRAIADSSKERAELDRLLRQAVEEQVFELFYQPIIDTGSQKIVALEALIRWHHDQLGWIPPEQFIPLAEENGMIFALGEWVLDQTCRQLRQWHDSGLAPIKVSVNVSGKELDRPGAAARILAHLQRYRLPPQSLYVELTETAVMKGEAEVRTNLKQLREADVRIALDDFGTGYSSLSYLRNLPIDTLKIDRSFVQELDQRNHAVILNSIIAMAHTLEMSIIAEGVEDLHHLTFLKKQGVQLLQGYLFSPPRPASEITSLLQMQQRVNLSPPSGHQESALTGGRAPYQGEPDPPATGA